MPVCLSTPRFKEKYIKEDITFMEDPRSSIALQNLVLPMEHGIINDHGSLSFGGIFLC